MALIIVHGTSLETRLCIFKMHIVLQNGSAFVWRVNTCFQIFSNLDFLIWYVWFFSCHLELVWRGSSPLVWRITSKQHVPQASLVLQWVDVEVHLDHWQFDLRKLLSKLTDELSTVKRWDIVVTLATQGGQTWGWTKNVENLKGTVPWVHFDKKIVDQKEYRIRLVWAWAIQSDLCKSNHWTDFLIWCCQCRSLELPKVHYSLKPKSKTD